MPSMPIAVCAAAGEPILIEPDFEQSWPYEGPGARGLGVGATCAFDDQRPQLPRSDMFAWQLNDTSRN